MNRLLISVAGMVCVAAPMGAQAQTAALQFADQGSLSRGRLDYGALAQNGNGERTVSVTNNGPTPLTITAIRPSCACITVDWSGQVIAPRQRAPITIRYDTSRVGPFNKTVSFTTSDGGSTVLTVAGSVAAN